MNNLTNEESKKDQYMFIKMIHDINKIFVGHSLTSKLVNKYIYIYKNKQTNTNRICIRKIVLMVLLGTQVLGGWELGTPPSPTFSPHDTRISATSTSRSLSLFGRIGPCQSLVGLGRLRWDVHVITSSINASILFLIYDGKP